MKALSSIAEGANLFNGRSTALTIHDLREIMSFVLQAA